MNSNLVIADCFSSPYKCELLAAMGAMRPNLLWRDLDAEFRSLASERSADVAFRAIRSKLLGSAELILQAERDASLLCALLMHCNGEVSRRIIYS